MIKNRCLESGHYKINSSYSARDKINVHRILELSSGNMFTSKYLSDEDRVGNNIINSIIKSFNNQIVDKDSIIIGIDFVGMLIATKLAIVSQNPFSYMISKKNCEYYSEYDRKIKITDSSKIIIVTDVIVTGETVKSILDELYEDYYVNNDRIEKIFTIFRREVANNDMINKEKTTNYLSSMEEKIYSLNNEIDIELCLKERCIFKENNICLCENRCL